MESAASGPEEPRETCERAGPAVSTSMAPEPHIAAQQPLAVPIRQRPLPLWLRVVVLVVGWLILLVGVAGLVLPGIQGIATIVAGLAILSVASETAHRWMRRSLQRWPKVWLRVDRFRARLHDWLHRMVHKG
jgi:putative transmembrane protein PGPGW